MSRPVVQPTGHERFFPEAEIIVSKTDLTGKITYANKLFLDIADYTLEDVIGQPHNMIRSPHMPRCIYKLLWDRIAQGQEIFAYVSNLARNGDHYWVLALVTPSFDSGGKIHGFHSNRRVPGRDAVATMQGLYRQLSDKEAQGTGAKDGLNASEYLLFQTLADKGTDYDRFIHSL